MARERRKGGPVEMVGRHEKWTGHNESKVGENRGRAQGATVLLLQRT